MVWIRGFQLVEPSPPGKSWRSCLNIPKRKLNPLSPQRNPAQASLPARTKTQFSILSESLPLLSSAWPSAWHSHFVILAEVGWSLHPCSLRVFIQVKTPLGSFFQTSELWELKRMERWEWFKSRKCCATFCINTLWRKMLHKLFKKNSNRGRKLFYLLFG